MPLGTDATPPNLTSDGVASANVLRLAKLAD
jgi:hypothetical protein